MRIDKLVKKYQRLILGTIVALVALSLVVTFGPGIGRGGASDDGGPSTIRVEGIEVKVSKAEYARIRALSDALIDLRALMFLADPRRNFAGKIYLRAGLLRGRHNSLLMYTVQAQRMFGRPLVPFDTKLLQRDDAKVHDLVAWETLILLEHARRMEVGVSSSEMDHLIRAVYVQGNPPPEGQEPPVFSKEAYARWVRDWYRLTTAQFEEAIRDTYQISKYLHLISLVEYAGLGPIYERRLEEDSEMRVWFATIDPRAELSFALRPVQVEEIRKYYRKNKESFKTPPMAQVLVVAALYDKFAPPGKPDEAQLKSFYEANKGYFQDEKNQALPFDRARPQVRERWLRENLQQDLFKKMYEVRNEIEDQAEEALRKKRQADPRAELKASDLEPIVDRIVKSRNEKGEPFSYDLTAPFPRSQAADVKKGSGLGSDSSIDRFAFDEGSPEGRIWNDVDSTEKGCFVYLQYRKIEPREAPLTGMLEEHIRGALQKEQLQALGEARAKAAAKLVGDEGREASSRAYHLKFARSGYFGPHDSDPKAFPDEGTLASQARQAAHSLRKIGQGTWTSYARDSRTLYAVLALDDLYVKPDKDIDAQSKSEWSQATEERRLQMKEQMRLAILDESGLSKVTHETPPGEREPPPLPLDEP